MEIPPHIYINIRSGHDIPTGPRIEKHQRTTNEDLAQLAFAAFFQEPFTAKDKKTKLFTKDELADKDILRNENYDKIFRYEPYMIANKDIQNEKIRKRGILFEKNKYEIDEVLFIKYLYKCARTEKKKQLQRAIDKIAEELDQESDIEKVKTLQERKQILQQSSEIGSICMFYSIVLYYTLKETFNDKLDKTFDYYKFYNDKSYRQEIIGYFNDNFLSETISIIAELLRASNKNNVGNWIRAKNSQELFKDILNQKLRTDIHKLEKMYNDFSLAFKTSPIC